MSELFHLPVLFALNTPYLKRQGDPHESPCRQQ